MYKDPDAISIKIIFNYNIYMDVRTLNIQLQHLKSLIDNFENKLTNMEGRVNQNNNNDNEISRIKTDINTLSSSFNSNNNNSWKILKTFAA